MTVENTIYRFDYGELNDVTPPATPIHRPASGRENALTAMGAMNRATYTTSGTGTRQEWYGTVLRVEPAAETSGSSESGHSSGWEGTQNRFQDANLVRIKVRVPEAMPALPEPISLAASPDDMTMDDNIKVDNHPTFVGRVPGLPIPNVGDIVKVFYDRQSGQAIYLERAAGTGVSATFPIAHGTGAGSVFGGGSGAALTPGEIPIFDAISVEEVAQLATDFDTMVADETTDPVFLAFYAHAAGALGPERATELGAPSSARPNSSKTWAHLESQIHPSYIPYIKALAVEMWKGNEACAGRWVIYITSLFRSGAASPSPPAAAAGTSYHNWGLAVDFNAMHFSETNEKDYQLAMNRIISTYSSDPVPGSISLIPESATEAWLFAGIPACAKKIGFSRWGGTKSSLPARSNHLIATSVSMFNGPYMNDGRDGDCVHFMKNFGFSTSALAQAAADGGISDHRAVSLV
tara:strand:+ start:244 stop:1635 length:1392 start_codon:yes stop_codon:yes gene_type:complete